MNAVASALPIPRTVMPVMMEWDYGIRARGISVERALLLPSWAAVVRRVEPFWYDAYFSDLPELQRALLRRADEVAPDLIFVMPYRDQIAIDTLERLRSRYRTAVWLGDDHWRFDAYSTRYAPHYTHVVTTDPWAVSRYRAIGIEPIVSDWAAKPAPPDEPPDPRAGSEFDVSFIGEANPIRRWFVRELARRGVAVTCFGPGWPRGRVSYDDMGRIFRTSRVNLNLSNSASSDIRYVLGGPRNFLHWVRSPKRVEQVKARNFEIPMAGGFQLSNYALGLERHFRIGEEIALYGNVEDCARQIRYFLENERERFALTLAGFRRARADHSYAKRYAAILGTIFPDEFATVSPGSTSR